MSNRDTNGRYLPGHDCPGPGRETRYDDRMNAQAYRLALLGLTDEQIADALNIATSTLYLWKKRYPAFSEAIQNGGLFADAKVAESLYHRAIGMSVASEKAFRTESGEVVVVKVKTEIPPDAKAAAHWLRNRQRKQWGGDGNGASSGQILSGLDPTDLTGLSREELLARLEVLKARREGR